MAAHTLSEKTFRRTSASGAVVQLGWSHFWLLIGVLSGILGLVGVVFVAYLTLL